MAAKSNEIHITRVYDAPVNLVWDAWTDPKKVALWWGPRGFTITTHSKDLRPGGHWSYTMHGPDGTDYENKTIYHVVEKHARLEYDHGGNDDRPPLFRVTVTFAEHKGKTTMEMTMALATAEAAAEAKKFIKKAGGNATWDRLAEYLEENATGKNTFVINRSFDAPIETVFEMFSNPRHFSAWLPPTGYKMEYLREELREGGTCFYRMINGETMYGRISYEKIHAPDRLVYSQQFCDENERVCRHKMAPLWPETMLTRISLAAEGPAQTRVTIQWQPKGSLTAEEKEAFREMKSGITQGWTGSFDKLEELLKKD